MTRLRRCRQHTDRHRAGCGTCRTYTRTYTRHRHQHIAGGTWDGRLVDVEPVRNQVRALQAAGMRLVDIAADAGVNYGSVNSIMYNPKLRHCTLRIADAILAVTARPVDRATVDATGVRRRIQALVRAGWSQQDIGDHLGIDHSRVWQWANQNRVTKATFATVRAVYDRLHLEDGPTIQAVQMGRRRGWPPPEAWSDDTIDDPGAQPYDWCRDDVDDVLVARVAEGKRGFGDLNQPERIELWRRYGHTAAVSTLQKRWGVSWGVLDRLRRAADVAVAA